MRSVSKFAWARLDYNNKQERVPVWSFALVAHDRLVMRSLLILCVPFGAFDMYSFRATKGIYMDIMCICTDYFVLQMLLQRQGNIS